jgi:OOP family OmpA-OmpF porin
MIVIGTGQAAGLTLDMPAKVLSEERRSEAPGSYALPIGPFDGTSVPTRLVEGAVDQRAYRLAAEGMTTLSLLKPLRDQLQRDGFKTVFECEARTCGGFDFRFGTEVMPEPDMHVNLGDFRFLAAEKPGETVSVLVSRSVQSGFVQITRVGALPLSDAAVTEPMAPAVELGTTEDLDELPAPGDIGTALETRGAVALDDLVFASGVAALEPREYPSLAALAAWMAANPDKIVALVGHTDASGSLVANIALSERRAELVRQALIDRYSVEEARLTSEGVGYLAPRAPNQTEEGRQKNRRVEAIVTSTR